MDDHQKKQIPKFVSLLTYFGMLFGAMALLIGPEGLKDRGVFPVLLYLGWAFPCGLGLLMGPGSGLVGIVAIVISYVSFIGFFFAFVCWRGWRAYGLLCLGFAVLLLLNVAGCHGASKSFSGITMKTKPAPCVQNPEFIQSRMG